MNKPPEIAAFVKERNEVLLSGDIDRCSAFLTKHNPGFSPSTRLVAEIMMHKARMAVLSLPIEARKESKKWLTDRGYFSFDDGDL